MSVMLFITVGLLHFFTALSAKHVFFWNEPLWLQRQNSSRTWGGSWSWFGVWAACAMNESHFFPFLAPCNNGMYDVHSHDMQWGHTVHVNTMNGCKNDVFAERNGGRSFLCGTQEEREERKGEHGGTKQTTRVRRLTVIAVGTYRYTGSERGEQRSASWEGLQEFEPSASQLRGQFGWNMYVCCYIRHHDAVTDPYKWVKHESFYIIECC